MKNKLALIIILFAGVLFSCNKDLNRIPTNDVTADVALKDYAGYQSLAAKLYASNALSGNSGNGSSDMQGFDPGSSDFLREYWNCQVLSTDEAINGWGDLTTGTTPMHTMQWTPQTGAPSILYNRCFYIIAVCNEFIRQTADATMSSRSLTADQIKEMKYYQAEARFIRAFQYWVLMDLFGNPTFITENDPIGSFIPPQKKASEIFTYVESELKAIDDLLKPAKTNEYGRVDQAADWALLARMYLNAKTYTGTERYTDAITYSSKVINAGYSLHTNYRNLFLADNNLNNPEVIWSLNFDGTKSQIHGGTTYLVNSAINTDMADVKVFGVTGGWGGNRSTSKLPLLFPDYSGNTDKRAMFTATNASTKLSNDDLGTFRDGLPVVKFKNVTSAGVSGPETSADGSSCSIDFPLFRLAEQYLIYAEAVLRGGTGGNAATALGYINALRTRAGATAIAASVLTTDFILDERGRELYWECFRRTDLIRYGKYTGSNYVWPWKGNAKDGVGVDAHLALFPLPATLTASMAGSITQNTGY